MAQELVPKTPIIVQGKRRTKKETAEIIGVGGYGRVVKYKEEENTALKWFPKIVGSSLGACIREYEILSKCDHPYIMKVKGWHIGKYDIGVEQEFVYNKNWIDGELHMKMELADCSLHDKIESGFFKDNPTAVKKAIAQILLALQYLHQNNIIHRDISAPNILFFEKGDVDGEWCVKLCDFGMSTPYYGHNAGEYINMKYRGPELYTTQSYDHRVDVWPVGIILLSMLLGKHPFNINTEMNNYSVAIELLKICPQRPAPNMLPKWAEKIIPSDEDNQREEIKRFNQSIKTKNYPKSGDILKLVPEEYHQLLKKCLTWYVMNRSTSTNALNSTIFSNMSFITDVRLTYHKTNIVFSSIIKSPSREYKDVVIKFFDKNTDLGRMRSGYFTQSVSFGFHSTLGGIQLYYDVVKHMSSMMEHSTILAMCFHIMKKYNTCNEICQDVIELDHDLYGIDDKKLEQIIQYEPELLKFMNYNIGKTTLYSASKYSNGRINEMSLSYVERIFDLTMKLFEGDHDVRIMASQIITTK